MLRKKTRANDPSDWFAMAGERLKAADTLWRHEGLTFAGIELLQEGVERYLKGYLIAKGWRLVKTHDLRRLVREAGAFEPRFEQFAPLALELTADFFAQHYPGSDLAPVGENYEEMRRQTGEMVTLIHELLPQYSVNPNV